MLDIFKNREKNHFEKAIQQRMWKILLLLCNLSVVLTVEQDEKSRFLNVTCTSSEYGTLNDKFCLVTNGLLSAGGTLTRTLFNVNMNHKLFYKTGNTERQVIKIPPIDMCSYLNGKSSNPFGKMLVDYLRLYAPQVARRCPWKGSFGVQNLSLANTKLVSLIPSGNYRHILQFSDDKDKNVFTVDYNSILVTAIKFNN